MYQIYVWAGRWIEIIPIISATTEVEIEPIGLAGSADLPHRLYAIIEDGHEIPSSILWNGQLFPRKPIED